MTDKKGITRRDFVNGFAMSVAAGSAISPLQAAAEGALPKEAVAGFSDVYPPEKQGMRGNHRGSFETAHALSWQGKTWTRPAEQTDDTYDLVVVGGGISGLSAAWFFREKHGPDAKILIIDNHDDFGGHAKRNEFSVDGKTLIGYGGTQNIEGAYSEQAAGLLKSLTIDLEKFNSFYDRDLYTKHGMGEGIFFDKNFYSEDSMVKAPFWVFEYFVKNNNNLPVADVESAVAEMPLSDVGKKSMLQLLDSSKDFLAGMSVEEKMGVLMSMTYDEFLRQHAKAPEEVVLLLRNIWQDAFGLAGDYTSAIAGTYSGFPGTLGLGVIPAPTYDIEPIIQHFPDGNATIARLLVRGMIPRAAAGNSMEDIVTAKVDYNALDLAGNNVRLRLNSTVVNAVNVKGTSENEKQVEVTYVQNGETHRVNSKHTIMACYNHILPFLCPDMPKAQKEALDWPEKVPMAFVNIALRNWKAFEKLGVQKIYSPQSEFGTFWLDYPVSMGGYEFSQSPDQPIVLHIPYVPNVSGEGLTPRQRFKAGRHKLYSMSFSDFETKIFDQLDRMLSPGGFDVARDVAGMTVNRWPHGYTYQYSDLYDAPNGIWEENGPHVAGRAKMGRISIANCDSHAKAYTQAAIDAAYRAVNEQVAEKDSIS